jgi:ArsR family transcriptional regulator, lead/cadmium/zinc/bismuth-responsive transcriptional repressor
VDRALARVAPTYPAGISRASVGGCVVRGADPERVAEGRGALLDDETYGRLAEIFRTLADASRAKIVHSLLRQELCTCDLAAITCLSEPSVSQHLRLLRALQLVKTRRDRKKVFYSLADAHVRFLLTVTLRHLSHGEISSGISPAAEAIGDTPGMATSS